MRRPSPEGSAPRLAPAAELLHDGAEPETPRRRFGRAQRRGRGGAMKLITAVIKPFKLDEVREALAASASTA